MTDLPHGWAWATLDDVGTYVNGRGFKRSEWSSEGRPIIRIQNLTGSSALFNYFEGEVGDRFIVRPGDLLISWAATLGAYIWRGPEGVLNQHIFRVESAIDKQFHLHLIRFLLAELYSSTHGSGIVHITRSKFSALRFGLPPLAEQKRIAAVLDEHHSRLDAATVSLSIAQAKVDRLERNVVEHGLGRLDQTSYVELSECLSEPLRNGFSGRATTSKGGVRTLTLSAVTQREFTDRNTKIADVGSRSIDALWLADGDLLIQRSNTPELVGTSAVYRGKNRWAIYPDLLIRVRLKSDMIPEFVDAVLSSTRIRRELRASAKGLAGSMPKIDQNTVSRLKIPVITMAQQARVVDQITDAKSYVSRLSGTLHAAAVRSTRLRRALLAEAFGGRLVLQDPEDEPAWVLLNRINAERDKDGPPRRRQAGASP